MMDGRSELDAGNEPDFLWRHFRSWVHFRLLVARGWLRHGHFIRARKIRAYLDSHPVRKIHLGSTYPLNGFLNSQITDAVPIDINRRLPFPDNSLDLIYNSHVVEHIHKRQFHAFLKECLRVLRPGGKAIFSTPSIKNLVTVLYGNDEKARDVLLERTRMHSGEEFHSPGQHLNIVMRAYGHRWLYDSEYAAKAGQQIGFSKTYAVDNLAIPDPQLVDYLKARKSAGWFLETETFVFEK
jgi:predicted SAM-dependent methyltransferase